MADLVGTWRFKEGTYVFNGDGTYAFQWHRLEPMGPGQPMKRASGNETGKWSADATTAYFKNGRGLSLKMNYVFSNGKSTLELRAPYAKSGDVFTRVPESAVRFHG